MRGRGPPNKLGQRDEVQAPARDQTARALREARRSGFLSLPARNLTAFPQEVYHLEDHMDKDEKKWECVDLVKIDLSHNAIPEIHDAIAELATLTGFKMAQNALNTLPDGLYQLTGLKALDLSHNQLTGTLSEGFGALVNLKELSLAANKLQCLPESIAQLTDLEILRVEENNLTKLPVQIGLLKKLHTLTIHTNNLTTLPASFSGLTNLQTLDMKKNKLETMSQQLASLQSLKYLDVRQNKLVVFPQLPQSAALDQVFLGFNMLSQIDESSIMRVKDSITVLDLRDNKLGMLPENIAFLHRLKTLDVSNNDLSDLPPGLGYLKFLNHMVVDGNPLRAIRRGVISGGCETLKKYLRTRGSPPEGASGVMEREVDELQVLREKQQATKASAMASSSSERLLPQQQATASATSLRSSTSNFSGNNTMYRDAAASGALDMSNHVLQSLPQELLVHGGLASTLVHLNLSKNHLTSLPAQVGEMQSLVTLTVEENQLRTIDPAVASLPHLQRLLLRKNQLTSEATNGLFGSSPSPSPLSQSLRELDLRNNSLTEMPLSIRSLSVLETLQLALNKIETLDGFPWQELSMVSVVSVSDNKLKSLGQIFLLPRLASLSFENNNLSQVPCELALCPHLKAIYMNGNPQKTVRGGIIAKGSLEILMYLKNKLPPNATLQAFPSVSAAPPRVLRSGEGATTSTAAAVVVAKPMGPARNKNLSMYAATAAQETEDDDEYGDGDERERSSVAAVAPLRATSMSGKEAASVVRPGSRGIDNGSNERDHQGNYGKHDGPSDALCDLDKQIAQLEVQLDSHAVSAAKRFALKKELALLRSAKIRETRRLASAT